MGRTSQRTRTPSSYKRSKRRRRNSSFLGKIYQIDIGYSEYKIVSSLDLYKFSRPEESSQSRDSTPSPPTNPTEFLAPVLKCSTPLPWERRPQDPVFQASFPQKLKAASLPEILKEVASVVEQAGSFLSRRGRRLSGGYYLITLTKTQRTTTWLMRFSSICRMRLTG